MRRTTYFPAFRDRQVEAVEHVESAIDYVLDDVAFVWHADIGDVLARDHAVLADKPECACQHLVTAGAVVRVQQQDFVGFLAGDLIGVAKPEHVFCELALALIANTGLADHERLKPFVAQTAQDVDGGNVGVAFGTAFVFAVREDGRGNLANLVVRKRRVSAQHRGPVMERALRFAIDCSRSYTCDTLMSRTGIVPSGEPFT
ncbi:hypothetical protein QFZ91_006140 [Paraburkholderia sp. JPY419]